MAHFIGIDLGTSTTLVARLNEAGYPEIIRNEEGDNLTPSAVWFENAEKEIIGKEAKRMVGVADDSRIFIEYKRDMHDADVVHEVDGRKLTPKDLSALMLRKIRLQLEATGIRPDAVVITIPANFMDEARVNTLLAARDAGFDMKEDALINEPTAAALYYITSSAQPIHGRCLVYDFGGGTFDATILHVEGHDIQVKTSEGVQHLGGKDIDERLLSLIAEKFTKATGAPFDAKELAITKWDIEQNYKHPLSIREKVSVVIRSPEHGPVRFDITRAEFEEAISTLIAKANLAVENALDRAGLKPSDIDHIFLAGGATRIPAVAAGIEKLIGKKAYTDNPDEAVAKGAALYAGLRNKAKLGPGQRSQLGHKEVTEVTPHYYGTIVYSIELGRSVNSVLIEKDQKLPCSITKTFVRTAQNRDILEVKITQCSERTDDPDFVKVVHEDEWRGLPPVLGKESKIEVTYSYDTNGIVRCRFVDEQSGQVYERDITQRPDGGDDDDPSNGTANKRPPNGPKDPGAGNIDDILL